MGRKVFVSYKYKDSDVESLASATQPTWPCDYVDYIRDNILDDDDIYKGENSDEDISSSSSSSSVKPIPELISGCNVACSNTFT